MKKRNPGKPGSAFKRCEKAVASRGGAYSPSGVCAAAGRKKYGAKKFQEMAAAGKRRKAKRGNPAEAAAEAYQDFHGRPSEETVTVKQEIHYHRHLAGIGKLEQLQVRADSGDLVTLTKFKGAILAMNEKRNQLFVEGGDQAVDLRQFGIPAEHEYEVLGEVVSVDYYTRKDHLGSDGGTAIYRHKFHAPRPSLVYDVVNKHLAFAGGSYTIPPEGIDQ